MEVFMKISMPGFEDTDGNREALRIEIEVKMAEWAWKYGISAELADDPGEQYNLGYDAGRDAMYIDMENEKGAQAE